MGAAIANRRVLGAAEAGGLLYAGIAFVAFAAIAAWWPRVVAWPLAVLAFWYAATLLVRFVALRRRARREPD
jgi:cardiolipin synthase